LEAAKNFLIMNTDILYILIQTKFKVTADFYRIRYKERFA
jgi:hypothetical protein